MNHLIWRVPLYILSAIGVPIGLVAALGIEVFLDRPWRAAGLFIAYEVFLYLILWGSTGRDRSRTLPQKLASGIVEFGSSLLHSIPVLFSVRRRRYLRHVREQCRDLDFPGFSGQGQDGPMLWDVFVEPSLSLHPLNRRSADSGSRVPRDLRTGRYSIWTYLRPEAIDIQGLVITSPPGGGKTALLKHVALTLAAGPFRRFKAKAPHKLPLLLAIRDHAAAIAGAAWPGDYDLVQAILDSLKMAPGPDLPAGWFERLLGRGKFLVLLDGLDEVAEPDLRKQVVAWVQEQMLAYPQIRFVVASRPLGYLASPIDGAILLEIGPFSRAQVERFVRKQYLAHETGGARKGDNRAATKVEAGARNLLGRIWSTYSLAELAANPLFLAMLAALHHHRRPLPGSRVELVAEVCQILLGERRAAQGGEDALTPAGKMSVLQPLAYEMMSRRVLQVSPTDAEAAIREHLARVAPGASAGDFLRDVEHRSGLLVRHESGMYAFARRTFQEFLAAGQAIEQNLGSDLVACVGDAWWHETTHLYAARSDASTIVSACLAHDPSAIPVLALAVDCMAEARDVSPDVRARYDEALWQGTESEDPERRRMVADALLARRLHDLVPLDDGRSADAMLIAHAEYQLFLDEKWAHDEFRRPDHWTGHRFLQGTAQEPALGVRYADALAFCEWLTEREGKRSRYRIPTAAELDAMTGLETGSQGLGYWSVDEGKGRCVGADAPGWDAAERVARQWVSDVVAVDLARACTRAVDLASAIGRASALDLDLAAVLARARDRAINLAGACNRANTSAIDLATIGVRDLASDLASARAIARARNLPRNLARIIAVASARACAIARDVARARDLVCAQTGDGPLAAAVDLVGDDDLGSAIDLTRACDLARTINFAGAVNLASARAVDRELAHTVAANLARTVDHGSLADSAYQTARSVIGLRTPLVGLGLESVDSLLAYVRRHTVLSLWLVETSLIRAPSWWARHVRAGSELDRWEKLEQLQSRLTDLYIDLCIWDARVKGEFPPFEGIRIIRERAPS